MLVMGIIKSVSATHLFVSLPGKLSGRVPITNISDSYTKALKAMVDDGELVNVRIVAT
jgi:ribosomal protein S1